MGFFDGMKKERERKKRIKEYIDKNTPLAVKYQLHQLKYPSILYVYLGLAFILVIVVGLLAVSYGFSSFVMVDNLRQGLPVDNTILLTNLVAKILTVMSEWGIIAFALVFFGFLFGAIGIWARKNKKITKEIMKEVEKNGNA